MDMNLGQGIHTVSIITHFKNMPSHQSSRMKNKNVKLSKGQSE
jgi:hypothetical protein